MPLVITRVGGALYKATLTRPHRGGGWTTPQPMTRDSLIQALRDRGCHPTDISDAFYEADPDWLIRE
jgi:hypothetical protein